MPSRVFIHASNVHQGGGLSLLGAVLRSLNRETVLSVDARMPLPPEAPKHVQIKKVNPTIFHRLRAEYWLASEVSADDTVLCFGNLPPLYKLSGRTLVFVQNRYLIDRVPLDNFPLRIRLRIAMERIWLDYKICNADELVVQTPTMARLLSARVQGKIPVHVLPFVGQPEGYVRKMDSQKTNDNQEFDFLYVASGEPHKNHTRLIQAWCALAEENIFPSLCLTLEEDRFAPLLREIATLRQRHNLKIHNLSKLSHEQVLGLYGKSGAVIYPSTFESFGLPLIEARQAGLPVLASELDYVRDVLDPEQTFDPESAISIARAVKRFLKIEEPALPLMDAGKFMTSILQGTK